MLNFTGFNPPPSGPNALTGLRFDAGFSPDQMVFINTASGNCYVDQFSLPTAAAATKTYRGNGAVGSGNGTLSGGTNPNGMQAAMDNTNTLGVTLTDAGPAATARNGFDLFIPYGDIGLSGPGGTARVAAFILRSSGTVTSQWLPGLPAGTGHPGTAPNMTTISGDQFAVVPLSLPGDINGDNAVNAADLAALLQVLLGVDTNPAHVTAADLTRDGTADGRDIPPFVNVLLNP